MNWAKSSTHYFYNRLIKDFQNKAILIIIIGVCIVATQTLSLIKELKFFLYYTALIAFSNRAENNGHIIIIFFEI
jgi:hypothetical protein